MNLDTRNFTVNVPENRDYHIRLTEEYINVRGVDSNNNPSILKYIKIKNYYKLSN